MLILGLIIGLLIAILILVTIITFNIAPATIQGRVKGLTNKLDIDKGDIIEPPPEGEEVFNTFFK
jgi:hypothetical protein